MSRSIGRRPLKTRQHNWPRRLAHFFVGCGMTPNQMSMAGVVFALVGACAYLSVPMLPGHLPFLFFAAAMCIQLRLLANMLDGLMAVEENRKTPTGALYNELPDRAADTLFLVAVGYAGSWPVLGWLAAILALATAHVRAFGGSLGYEQDFSGPMAKPHRMFALTVGSLLAMMLPYQPVISATLGVIILGCAVTVVRRTRHIVRKLSGNGNA